jgi:hypothetical protein
MCNDDITAYVLWFSYSLRNMISCHCSIWNALARAVLLSCTYTLSFPCTRSISLARAVLISCTYTLSFPCTCFLARALSISCTCNFSLTYTCYLILFHICFIFFSLACAIFFTCTCSLSLLRVQVSRSPFSLLISVFLFLTTTPRTYIKYSVL